MSEQFKLPTRGFVFWPVCTGDSTTIVIKPGVVMQLDLHHLAKADGSDDPAWAVVDELVRLLPKKNGRPYLSLFALTHPDKDHILGFQELLKQVTIGEIWHTPRIIRDWVDDNDLCDDAEAFYQEVHRRRKAVIANPTDVKAGDRVRIIGHDDILNEDRYKAFPTERTSHPGTSITIVDEVDLADCFNAFVHAPFKVDAEDTRNNTSLSLHVRLSDGDGQGEALFFGDREYPTLKQIFEATEAHEEYGNTQYLMWDVMIAPHHCSKKAMFWQEDGEDEEKFKHDIMDFFEKYRKDDAYIIASADADFTDVVGHNPPHGKARKKYEAIVDAGHFICTHEHPDEDNPKPVVFEVTAEGLSKRGLAAVTGLASVVSAVASSRGTMAPPTQQVGFGRVS
ncbi:hypothetical protein [Luteolibacter soli]|uniref:Metallohydrolase n=1 Tax=Luteolibacter soli TaxID=3135280 RepID=A0ABU9AVG7_9BACT